LVGVDSPLQPLRQLKICEVALMRQLDPEYERFGQQISASFGWTVSLYVLVVDICLAVSFPISIPRLVVILLLLVASAYLNPFIERQVKGFLYRTFDRRTVDIAGYLLMGVLVATSFALGLFNFVTHK
jgi:hypothetical protein